MISYIIKYIKNGGYIIKSCRIQGIRRAFREFREYIKLGKSYVSIYFNTENGSVWCQINDDILNDDPACKFINITDKLYESNIEINYKNIGIMCHRLYSPTIKRDLKYDFDTACINVRKIHEKYNLEGDKLMGSKKEYINLNDVKLCKYGKLNKCEFEKLCQIQASLKMILFWFQCSKDELFKWCMDNYHCEFKEIYELKRQGGFLELQFKMWQRLDDPRILKIAISHYLGITDAPKPDQAENNNKIDKLIDAIKNVY